MLAGLQALNQCYISRSHHVTPWVYWQEHKECNFHTYVDNDNENEHDDETDDNNDIDNDDDDNDNNDDGGGGRGQ